MMGGTDETTGETDETTGETDETTGETEEVASASDCRSVLLPVMAARPDRVFTADQLAGLLERSPLRLGRRADRLVFDAMRKAEHRGWVCKVARGRYRFGTMPRTTLQRIVRWRAALDLGLGGPQRSAYASWHRTTADGRPVPGTERTV